MRFSAQVPRNVFGCPIAGSAPFLFLSVFIVMVVVLLVCVCMLDLTWPRWRCITQCARNYAMKMCWQLFITLRLALKGIRRSIVVVN